MDLGIKDLRVLVTAGAGGIGLEIARAFVREGAKVHICDVDAAALAAAKKSDPQLTQSVCDVADRGQVSKLFEGALGSVSRQSPYVNSNNYTHHALARMMSTDILRERRTRRVGDVMEAERRVDIVAESAFL